jgi:magnesium transporter
VSVDERLALAFIESHPQDAARLLERTEPHQVAEILTGLPPALAASVYQTLAPAAAVACGVALSDSAFAAIVEALPLDHAGAAMRGIDAARGDAVLTRLSPARADQLRNVLAYPSDSAGALADPLALAFPDDITVRDAQRQLRAADHHLFYHIFVIDRDRSLRGMMPIPDVMRARPQQRLRDVMQREPVSLSAHMDLATVAAHPAWRDADALPVVDGAGRMIGAIRHRMIRQLTQDAARPVVDTIVGLSELYWAGLSGILASLTPVATDREENGDVS